MKNIKKILGIILIIALVMSMGISSAFAAVNITVNRDSTYETGGTEESGNRAYTYKQIFRATENANHTSTGGGYDTDGTPGEVTTSPEKGISYYLLSTDTTQINALGTWDDTTKTFTKATGNNWFTLTKSADGTQYVVAWDNTATDTDTAQAAARWLDANYTALDSGNLTASTDGQNGPLRISLKATTCSRARLVRTLSQQQQTSLSTRKTAIRRLTKSRMTLRQPTIKMML